MATTSNMAPTISVCWQRPSLGRYKCNIDAAFSSSRNRTDIGICVRDSEGTFILAKVVSFLCIYSVDVGEALDYIVLCSG